MFPVWRASEATKLQTDTLNTHIYVHRCVSCICTRAQILKQINPRSTATPFNPLLLHLSFYLPLSSPKPSTATCDFKFEITHDDDDRLMALMAPASLKLVLRGPGVHNACHTTLSQQPSTNRDLFLPQRANADFSHTGIKRQRHCTSSTRATQCFASCSSRNHNAGTKRVAL